MSTMSRIFVVHSLALVAAACSGAGEDSTTTEAMTALQRVEDRLLVPATSTDDKGDAARIDVGDLTTSLPTVADGTLGSHNLRIVDAASSAGIAFNDNTVLYPSTHDRASTAVSVGAPEDETTIETYTVVHDRTAGEVYRFTVDLAAGERLQALSETYVVLLDAAGEVDTAIEAPWAVDANGVSVPLALAVEDSTVVMTVSHHAGTFEYPIVADPSVKQMKKICKGHWLWRITCEAVIVDAGKAVYKLIRGDKQKCVRAEAVWDVNSSNGSARFLGYRCAKYK